MNHLFFRAQTFWPSLMGLALGVSFLSLTSCSTIHTESRPDTSISVVFLSKDRRTLDLKVLRTMTGALPGEDKRFSKADYHIMAHNGIFLAYGTVFDQSMKDLVDNHLSRQKYIRRSFDELQIRSGRTGFQKAADNDLHFKAKSALLGSFINAAIFQIGVFDGTVYVMGVVTPSQGHFAAELLSRIEGVKRVVKVFEYVNRSDPASLKKASDPDGVKGS